MSLSGCVVPNIANGLEENEMKKKKRYTLLEGYFNRFFNKIDSNERDFLLQFL